MVAVTLEVEREQEEEVAADVVLSPQKDRNDLLRNPDRVQPVGRKLDWAPTLRGTRFAHSVELGAQ